MTITIQPDGHPVLMRFDRSVTYFGMDPDQAEAMAAALTECAAETRRAAMGVLQ